MAHGTEVQVSHRPVLLTEVLRGLALDADGWVVDCTFGRGGHSRAILSQLGPAGRLLALDRDPEAVASAEAEQLRADPRVTLVHAAFSELRQRVSDWGGLGRVSAVLMDLGVSSPQLDRAERGFSFLKIGPLDMRMNPTEGESAAEWLATVREDELAHVLWTYGEERYGRRIAKAVVSRRQNQPILTTRELADLIEQAVPSREKGKHPATRSFQAIRIHINQELTQVESVLEQSLDVLRPGGRLAVIAFHSLEDRIVKRFMRDAERGWTAEQAKSLVPVNASPRLKRASAAIKPGQEELAINVRARSAVLRVAEKIEP